MQTIQFELSPHNKNQLQHLCGQCDEHLHLIEQHLAVDINHRGFTFKIFGPPVLVELAKAFIEETYMSATDLIEPQLLMTNLQAKRNHAQSVVELDEDYLKNTESIQIKTSKALVKPKGPNQTRYLKRIFSHDVNFGIGPAGTGKTYLAVACAAMALEQGKVSRIVLVRPAVEAGENLGFLPGDLIAKVDPYLRPMYDALYDLLGAEKVMKLIERNIIEVAPLAFMRGRTLSDAFIILDEAQNTSPEQMKMFLTRIGFNSTAIITGDITQIDLPRNKTCGLRHVIDVLGEVPGISFTLFDNRDVVRHPLVQKIVQAYEKYEGSY